MLSSSTSFPVLALFGAGGSVRGLDVRTSGGRAIAGSGISNASLRDIDVTLASGASGGIALINTSATNTFQNVRLTGALAGASSAISLIGNTGSVNFVDSTVSSFTGGRVLAIAATPVPLPLTPPAIFPAATRSAC